MRWWLEPSCYQRPSRGWGDAATQQGCTLKSRYHWSQSATNTLFGPQEIELDRLVNLIVVSCVVVAARRQTRTREFGTSTASINGRTNHGSNPIDRCNRIALATRVLGRSNQRGLVTRNPSSLHVMVSPTDTHVGT